MGFCLFFVANLGLADHDTNPITPCYPFWVWGTLRASPHAAGPLVAGFLAFGCGLLAGWLSGWPAGYLACEIGETTRIGRLSRFLASHYQRHIFMSLVAGLLALQYSDRFVGLFACWAFAVWCLRC